jgi:hypothetical protein
LVDCATSQPCLMDWAAAEKAVGNVNKSGAPGIRPVYPKVYRYR